MWETSIRCLSHMCPDWGQNLRPFGLQDDTPIKWVSHWPGLSFPLFWATVYPLECWGLARKMEEREIKQHYVITLLWSSLYSWWLLYNKHPECGFPVWCMGCSSGVQLESPHPLCHPWHGKWAPARPLPNPISPRYKCCSLGPTSAGAPLSVSHLFSYLLWCSLPPKAQASFSPGHVKYGCRLAHWHRSPVSLWFPSFCLPGRKVSGYQIRRLDAGRFSLQALPIPTCGLYHYHMQSLLLITNSLYSLLFIMKWNSEMISWKHILI